MSRPSSIPADIVEVVIEGLSDGAPLRQLARINGFSKSAWYRLMEADKEIAGRVAQARARGFDALADEAIEIADDGRNDWETRERDDGSTDEALNHEHVSRSKLRIETRLKLLACWDPKRYGAKAAGDAENPIHVVNTIRREVIDPNAG